MTHPLVTLARETIEGLFSKKKPELPEGFTEHQGCFVTINKKGTLRGCIGYITSDKPLKRTVIEAAKAAALHDPRFPPLREEELKDIEVEVSILSKPMNINTENPMDKVMSFVPGKTGLIVQRGWRSGLLLPQVFDEETTGEEALAMTCQKAGLPEDMWKHNETQVYTFTADVHKE